MSFLAPLYALAALAVAAPFLFHLLQRTPQGRQVFSSLMFLRPSPPRLTRRRRLSNILLLLLRAAVLLLLAMAFARPFLRSATLLDLEAPSRSIALVVDVSASLRRDGLWDQLVSAANRFANDLRPSDQVMLLTFDDRPRVQFSFEVWKETEPSRRVALLREQIAGLQPSWRATDLGAALVSASDALLQQRLVENHNQPLQVVLFSDMQSGSRLDALQAYQWPVEVAVDLRTCAPPGPTNASLQALPSVADEVDAAQVRVLVRNAGDSVAGQFQLDWEDRGGEDQSANEVDVNVPPGQTRVVRLRQPRAARRLTIRGDDQDFDNSLFLTETTPQPKQLLFVGDADDGKQSLFYYLRQTSLDTRTRKVSIDRGAENGESLALLNPKSTPLVVVARLLTSTQTQDLRRYVERGGRVLVVLDESEPTAEFSGFLAELLQLSRVSIEPAEARDYAVLAGLDFQHPLLAPFADPRFSDFSKIRFWKHRLVTCDEPDPWRVVARFDDQSPALIEKPLAEGFVWILTSGWQVDESQLALSTKFVPLLHGLMHGPSTEPLSTASYEVGQPVPIARLGEAAWIEDPAGERRALPADAEVFEGAEEPGIYRVEQGDNQYSFAVNMASDESRTDPITPDRLEQLGVRLGAQKRVEVLRDEQRQMRSAELESRQQIWRWGIAAALLAVAGETWLGGRTGNTEERSE